MGTIYHDNFHPICLITSTCFSPFLSLISSINVLQNIITMASNAAITTIGILKLDREIEALLEFPGGGAFVVGVVGNGWVFIAVLTGLGDSLEGNIVVRCDKLVSTTQSSALKFLKSKLNQLPVAIAIVVG